MANYAVLKAAIEDVIKTNGENAITGQILQNSLIAMINALGAGYQFAGVATPETNPGTPDQNVMYIAGVGTYPNFGPTTVKDGEIGIFKYNGSWDCKVIQTDTTTNVININAIAKHPLGYATPALAVADVPERYRKLGCTVVFKDDTTEDWVMMIYHDDFGGDDAWTDIDNNWRTIGPVWLKQSGLGDGNYILQIGLNTDFRIVNNLETDTPYYVLSARQGKLLNEKIEGWTQELESIDTTGVQLPRPLLQGMIITKIEDATKLILVGQYEEAITPADLPYKMQHNAFSVKTESGTATDVTIGVRGVLSDDFINVNDYYGHSAAYASAQAARADVALTERKKGLYITYLLSVDENTTQWVTDQFIGDDIADWGVAANWIVVGPVSVSQNTSTTHKKAVSIKIGNEEYNIRDEATAKVVEEKIGSDWTKIDLAQTPLYDGFVAQSGSIINQDSGGKNSRIALNHATKIEIYPNDSLGLCYILWVKYVHPDGSYERSSIVSQRVEINAANEGYVDVPADANIVVWDVKLSDEDTRDFAPKSLSINLPSDGSIDEQIESIKENIEELQSKEVAALQSTLPTHKKTVAIKIGEDGFNIRDAATAKVVEEKIGGDWTKVDLENQVLYDGYVATSGSLINVDSGGKNSRIALNGATKIEIYPNAVLGKAYILWVKYVDPYTGSYIKSDIISQRVDIDESNEGYFNVPSDAHVLVWNVQLETGATNCTPASISFNVPSKGSIEEDIEDIEETLERKADKTVVDSHDRDLTNLLGTSNFVYDFKQLEQYKGEISSTGARTFSIQGTHYILALNSATKVTIKPQSGETARIAFAAYLNYGGSWQNVSERVEITTDTIIDIPSNAHYLIVSAIWGSNDITPQEVSVDYHFGSIAAKMKNEIDYFRQYGIAPNLRNLSAENHFSTASIVSKGEEEQYTHESQMCIIDGIAYVGYVYDNTPSPSSHPESSTTRGIRLSVFPITEPHKKEIFEVYTHRDVINDEATIQSSIVWVNEVNGNVVVNIYVAMADNTRNLYYTIFNKTTKTFSPLTICALKIGTGATVEARSTNAVAHFEWLYNNNHIDTNIGGFGIGGGSDVTKIGDYWYLCTYCTLGGLETNGLVRTQDFETFELLGMQNNVYNDVRYAIKEASPQSISSKIALFARCDSLAKMVYSYTNDNLTFSTLQLLYSNTVSGEKPCIINTDANAEPHGRYGMLLFDQIPAMFERGDYHTSRRGLCIERLDVADIDNIRVEKLLEVNITTGMQTIFAVEYHNAVFIVFTGNERRILQGGGPGCADIHFVRLQERFITPQGYFV